MKSNFDTQEIINESMMTIFPKKEGVITARMKDEAVKKVLVQLECGINDAQAMIAAQPAVVNQNYSKFDELLNRLYSLISEVEMLKQNAK